MYEVIDLFGPDSILYKIRMFQVYQDHTKKIDFQFGFQKYSLILNV